MKKAVIGGISGSLLLLLFYAVVMGLLTRSVEATVWQFRQLWYWILLLVVGFGTQVGLFVYLKDLVKLGGRVGKMRSMTTASGGTSAAGMVACCAHHLTEVLPIIGLSGLAVFLNQYQISLILLGIVMNGVGIFFLLWQKRKILAHQLLNKEG